MILIKLSTELVKVKLDFIRKTCRKFLCNQPGRVHRSASLTQYTFAQMFCFVLFCLISFLFCSSLLVFFLSLRLSLWLGTSACQSGGEAGGGTHNAYCCTATRTCPAQCHTHTRTHTLARVVLGPTCRISYIKLLSPRHVCCDMCVREREGVCLCVCVQLGQFKRRRRRRPCKGLHAHLPDSFHCGDLLCEAPVAFCGCVSHKQTTANTHTHTRASDTKSNCVRGGWLICWHLQHVCVCEWVRVCV